jgi:hypothetical protein
MSAVLGWHGVASEELKQRNRIQKVELSLLADAQF